jgi:hypothetical protein
MASVYDDSWMPWWLKDLEEWTKEKWEGVQEIPEIVGEVVDDATGAVLDSEKEKKEREQRKIDEARAAAKVITDLTPGPADPGIYDGGTYKPTDEYGRVLQGPFGQEPLLPRQAQVVDKKTPLEEKEDWMNQLLMSSLMAGGKATGRQAPSSYGVGAQVTPGNPWTMRADWEQDYRYLK